MTAHITIDPEWVAEATGVLAVAAIVFALVASARMKTLTRVFGVGSVYGLHRVLGVSALLAVVAHIGLVLLQSSSNWSKLVPWSGTSASKAADVSTYALLTLMAAAMWRQRRHYDRWRRWHLTLAAAVTVGALAHVILLDHLIADMWFAAWFAAVGCVAVAALLYRFAWRPLASSAFTVLQVHPESPTVSTVTLAPKHGRHRPNKRQAHFRPGQFGWLRLQRHPMRDHPYSFSSSAHDAHRVQVTVRRGGKFTEQLVSSRPGRPVWVDGPHGGFIPSDSAPGLVLVAAGVGVTPMMSILRTCADRRDKRPIRLVQSAESPHEMLFYEEINQLRRQLNLEVTRLVTHPHPRWRGRVGHIDLTLLHQILPGQPMRGQLHFFVCGPPLMVTDTSAALALAGVPHSRIHVERFLMPTPKGRPRAPNSAPSAGGRSRRGRAGFHRPDGVGRDPTLPLPVVSDGRRQPPRQPR